MHTVLKMHIMRCSNVANEANRPSNGLVRIQQFQMQNSQAGSLDGGSLTIRRSRGLSFRARTDLGPICWGAMIMQQEVFKFREPGLERQHPSTVIPE